MFKDYTIQTLLDKLDVIDYFEHSGHDLRGGEILSRQRQLHKTLGVEPPA